MKLPRDLSGTRLASLLRRYGYETTRQTGSHLRLTSTLKGVEHHVRERLGLRPGDEIEFVEDRSGFRVQKRLPASPFKKYRGYLKGLASRDPDDLVEQMRGR